jgi:cohesin loading factor subunit SCC2
MSERRRSTKEEHLLVTKVENITDVAEAGHDTGPERFEQLLQTLFKPKGDKDNATKVTKESNQQLVLAGQQIVDRLMERVLKSEETTIREMDTTAGSSHRTVACLTTTLQFAKTRPQLLMNHLQTLQPYLNVRTLELTGPLIEHPSEIFLTQLEEASMMPIRLHDKTVVSACLSGLGNATRNFTQVRDHLVSHKRCTRRTRRTRGCPRPEGGGGDQMTTQYNPVM